GRTAGGQVDDDQVAHLQARLRAVAQVAVQPLLDGQTQARENSSHGSCLLRAPDPLLFHRGHSHFLAPPVTQATPAGCRTFAHGHLDLLERLAETEPVPLAALKAQVELELAYSRPNRQAVMRTADLLRGAMQREAARGPAEPEHTMPAGLRRLRDRASSRT